MQPELMERYVSMDPAAYDYLVESGGRDAAMRIIKTFSCIAQLDCLSLAATQIALISPRGI